MGGAGFDPGDAPGYLYEKVADHLASRIRSGELKPHQPLPAEQRLAYDCGVSVGTIRHGTRLLRIRHLVITIRSKGTYVARTRFAADADDGDFKLED